MFFFIDARGTKIPVTSPGIRITGNIVVEGTEEEGGEDDFIKIHLPADTITIIINLITGTCFFHLFIIGWKDFFVRSYPRPYQPLKFE